MPDKIWMDAIRKGAAEQEKNARDAKTQEKPKGDPLGRVAAVAGRFFGKRAQAHDEDKVSKSLGKSKNKATREMAKDLKQHGKPSAKETSEIHLKAIIDNVTFTSSETIAWFKIQPVSLGFNPVRDIEHAIESDAVGFASLVGRRLHIRSTTRPYPVYQWAEDTYDDASAGGHPVDAQPGVDPDDKKNGKPEAGFTGLLVREQRRMSGAAFNNKWVYLGVTISGFRRFPDPRRELDYHHKTLEDLTRTLASTSLRAEVPEPKDMEWLIRRSIQLGLPVSQVGVTGDYDADDIPSLDSAADWTAEPMSGHIEVTGVPYGSAQSVTRYVTILTLGRLADQEIPQRTQSGWMQRTDRLPFPVEWAATVDVIPKASTERQLRGALDKIADQMKHYTDDHQMEPPRSLSRQNGLAREIQDDLDRDQTGASLRTQGWYRVAVAGASVAELQQRVQATKDVYGASAELVQTAGQYHYAREFIPGEPLATNAYVRRMGVKTLAAAIPHGTAEIGDRTGVMMGSTSGSARRAVAWHTHWDMERRSRSGLMLIVGGLGSGKSFAMGGTIYRSAMTGVKWSVFDPSDRLGRLCDSSMVPELAGKARYVNLMNGRDGELNPFRVVPDPVRWHYPEGPVGDSEYELAVQDAQATRKSLLSDLMDSFLPDSYRGAKEVTSLLVRVKHHMNYERESSPTQVIDILNAIAEDNSPDDRNLTDEHRILARDLAITYEDAAKTPIGRLIFPRAGAAPLEDLEDGKETVLTVYTLNGMPIPDAKDIAAGNIGEKDRMALAVLTMSAFLVQSTIYQGDPNARKGLAIDEGKVLNSFSAGKTLITKSSTDSRKFNARVILSSQNASHFNLDGNDADSLGNLVSAAMVGNTEEEAAQKAALNILGAPSGAGYEQILSTLRPKQTQREEVRRDADGNMLKDKQKAVTKNDKRDFIFSVIDDVAGKTSNRAIERITYDLDAHPHVAKALATDPDPYAGAPKKEDSQTGYDEKVGRHAHA